MKNNIFVYLVWMLTFGSSLSAIAQDSIPTESPQIIKEVVIRETKVKMVHVRDTVVIFQSDSTILSSLQTLNKKINAIGEKQESTLEQQKVLEGNGNDNWRMLKWIIGIGLILILTLGICLLQLLHIRRFLKEQDVTPVQAEPETITDVHDIEVLEDAKPEKPTLDAYNASVYEFTTINDHVSNLRKKHTKPLVVAMYRYLSLRSGDKATLLSEIRSSNISEDALEQFVALVSRIDDFLTQKKPIIDAWLYWEPQDNVNSYETAIRMPEGAIFDESLDEDVLGDHIEGQQISMVHKMGFYFPGNTIKPYRVKSVVSA